MYTINKIKDSDGSEFPVISVWVINRIEVRWLYTYTHIHIYYTLIYELTI